MRSGRPKTLVFPKKNGLEARVGIEPTMQLLQSRALPLGDPALRESPANKGNEWFGRKSGFGKTTSVTDHEVEISKTPGDR